MAGDDLFKFYYDHILWSYELCGIENLESLKKDIFKAYTNDKKLSTVHYITLCNLILIFSRMIREDEYESAISETGRKAQESNCQGIGENGKA